MCVCVCGERESETEREREICGCEVDSTLRLLIPPCPQANEELQSELDQLTGEPSPRAVLQQRRADFEADVEKLDKLIVSLGTHKETLAKKIAEREADLASKREEMGLLEKVCRGGGCSYAPQRRPRGCSEHRKG